VKHASRRRLLRGIGTGATAGIAGLSGCSGGTGGDGSSGGDGGGGGTTVGTAGSTGPTSFHVGVFSPFSGPFGTWGPAHELGTTIAAEDLQSEYDVDIEISTYDTETNPSAAQERMQRAVNADGIDFAFGGIVGTVIQALGSWTADNGVVYMTEQSNECYPLMFQVYGSTEMLSNAVAPEMANHADSWYLLYSDYVWGQVSQKLIESGLEAEGASVAGMDATPWPPQDRDFTQYINNAASSDADGLGLILPGTSASSAMRQARNEGLLDEFAIMNQQAEDPVYWGVGKWAAEAVDVSTTGWVNSVGGGDEFKQQITERGNLDPFVRHATSYLGLDQLVRAALRAGSKEADDVREALEGHDITDSRVNTIFNSDQFHWRACDHQLLKPMYVVSGMSQSEMQDSPYKQWLQVDKTVPGADVAMPCSEDGCDF